jgi:phage terminase Nu1 subunit (DNA packaging protein)
MKKGSTEKSALDKRLRKAVEASSPEDLKEVTGGEEEIFVDSQQDLGDELGVDRRTIIRWGREGAPRRHRGKYNVAEWKTWMAATGKSSAATAEPPSPAKYELEVRKLTAQCEALELAQSIKMGQYHLNDDCKLWVGKAMTAVRTLLLSIPSKMAPALEMRPKEEIEPMLRDAVDEALVSIHEKEWPTSKVA